MNASYKCHHCGKHFTKDGEEIYAIWPLILKTGEDNQLHWSWRTKNNEDYRFYHNACFEEIAGALYMVPQKRNEI